MNLLQKQNIWNTSLFGEYNEIKDINEGINNLANNQKNVISFNNIDISLIFFNEGSSQSISIITNKNIK